MANTTYFGWETPDDTDLVKDGAAAIRTLGQAIDTSMQDLEGGTTGQILSKNSNADMDFVWVTNDVGDITAVTAGTGISGGGTSGAVTITNSMATEIAAKGDLIVGTGSATFDNLAAGTNNHRLVAASGETTGLKYVADTVNTVIDAEGDLLVGDAADAVQRLAIGSNAQVLTVDTAVDGKIKWAAPASGALVKISRTTYSNVASQAFDNVFDSTYSSYLINIEKTSGSSNSNLLFQWRKNTTTVSANYYGNTFGYNYAGGVRNTASSGTSALTIMLSQGDITDRWSTAQIYANYVGYTKTTGERSLVNGTGLVSSETWTTVIGGGLYDSGGDNCNGFILSASSGNIYGTVTIYGVAI